MKFATTLRVLGFDSDLFHQYEEYMVDGFQLARVTTVNRDNYLVNGEVGELLAEVTGKLLYGAESNVDLPVVGDWVQVQYFDDNTLAVIHQILPRRTLIKRKNPGRGVEYQPIAANIDTAFIVQDLERDFNLRRLDRYLVMVTDSKITPIILLSKSDLISSDEIKDKISQIHRLYGGLKVIHFSNVTGDGFGNVLDCMKSGKTYCLIGSSGVGKTSLLNKILGEEKFAVGKVRQKDGRGRHITARRHLIILQNGSMVVDNPGMRELGNFGIEEGLWETFSEIFDIARNCQFRDCTHTHEKNCAILSAVEKGEIDQERYRNFLKIEREAAYYQMSYVEKRKRDKQFGKFCKQVMKLKKKK
jgi:ribosome biogenesis GTPase